VAVYPDYKSDMNSEVKICSNSILPCLLKFREREGGHAVVLLEKDLGMEILFRELERASNLESTGKI
jgi:hypothetical protein